MRRKNAAEQAEQDEPAVSNRPTANLGGFETQATEVLKALQAAIRSAIVALPEPITRSIDLQRMLNLDTKLAWQLYKFSESESVFGNSVMLPGILPLERFLTAAGKNGVPQSMLNQVRKHFDEFEQFVAARAGSRASFNSMVGAGNQDARAVDLYHRKAVFRAAAHFQGVQTDTHCITQILHPSMKVPGKWDLATLSYKIGVHRLRPDVRVKLASIHKNAPGADLNGKDGSGSWSEPLCKGPDNQNSGDQNSGDQNRGDPNHCDQNHGDEHAIATLLSDFCSNGSAEMILTHDHQDTLTVELAASGIGKKASTDWAFGVVERAVDLQPRQAESVPFFVNIASAVQTLVLDFIFCDTLFCDAGHVEPATTVNVYVGFGSDATGVPENDRKLALTEKVQFLGNDIDSLRDPLAPRLPEMVSYACANLGWNPRQMKVYRCRVEYPFLGSHIHVKFDFHPPG
jgi:hypothetical protein